MSDARRYLERVLIWPGSDQAPGWINVHVNSKNDNPSDTSQKNNSGKPWTVGWPFKTVDDALSRITWTESTDRFFNAWVCMSQQSACAKSHKTGKPKAVRKALNATAFKAIWVDVDVKANSPKHYASHGDAWAAVSAFRTKVGLPVPSVIVDSGGGLHIYWVSAGALTLEEWKPYAAGLKALLLQEGVKCDAGLTTDAARILRVPGTFNHKYDPPREVKMLHCGKDYDFPKDLAVLLTVTAAVTPQAKAPVVIELGAVFDTPDPAFAALVPDDALQAGSEPPGLTYVDPRPIFAKDGCLWLRGALRTGGAGFDQPQWNLSVLCTVFMENGDGIAHKISKGHTTYQPSDTQALYDRKVADRADRGIGYPSCAAIAGAGSTHCAACPHFSKGKSPLNIRDIKPVAVATGVNGNASLLLPDKYFVGDDGKIYLMDYRMVKGEAVDDPKQLFHNTIDDAYATKNPESLHLHISTDKGNWTWCQIRKVDFAGPGFEKKLAEAGIDYCGENKTKLEAFLMSFLARMKAVAEQQATVKFGWYRPKGPIDGFAYAGKIFRPDGTVSASGYPDTNLRNQYQPTGTVDNWHMVASYMFRQRRSDFDAAIAVAFAAPLMDLTGTTACILASMGEPGSGKSYAMKVAAAVWGGHKSTIERPKTSDNSMINKLGALCHLPAFWDEISDAEAQGRFFPAANQLSGGGEQGRMTRGIKQQDRGEWSTIVGINGNISWRDYIVSKQKEHAAGLRRVLEYWVPKDVPNPQGQVLVSESENALALLSHNYGGVGEQYAQYLVTHLDHVYEALRRNTAFFERKLQPDKQESMWLALCATLLTGAELAMQLPTPVAFNTTRLTDFLINVFIENRRYSAVERSSSKDLSEDYLAQYLNDRTNETLWTWHAPRAAGRPTVTGGTWRRLMPNASVAHGVRICCDRFSMTLRFSKVDFYNWCESKPDKRSAAVIVRSLKDTYNLQSRRDTLAAQTPFEKVQETVYEIQTMPYPKLKAFMDVFTEPTALNAELGTPTGLSEASLSGRAAGP